MGRGENRNVLIGPKIDKTGNLSTQGSCVASRDKARKYFPICQFTNVARTSVVLKGPGQLGSMCLPQDGNSIFCIRS